MSLSNKEYLATNYRMPYGKNEGKKLYDLQYRYLKALARHNQFKDPITKMHVHRELKRRHKLNPCNPKGR